MMPPRLVIAVLLARVATASAQGCSLCPGNAAPTKGDLNLIFPNLTCNEIAATASTFSEENCTGLQDIGASFICGCLDAQAGTCPGVCQDGSPVVLPDFQLPFSGGISCSFADVLAKATSNDTFCAEIQGVALFCGCPGDVTANATCSGVCLDGQPVPNPNATILGGSITCAQLDSILQFSSNETDCTSGQALGFFCGCANAPPVCSLCPDYAIPANGDFSFGNATCTTLVEAAQFTPVDDCISEWQASGTAYLCGCPGVAAGTCPGVCPDGSPVGLPDYVIPAFGGDTCLTFDNYAKSTSNDTECVNLQQLSAVCGCPGVPQLDKCTLCEDGSALPNPTFPVLSANSDCQALEDLFVFNASNQDCSAVQATIGVYCMCNNPNASATACRICGGDTFLPDPAITVTASTGAQTSCGELEFYATLGENFTCTEYQSMYSARCCADGGNTTVAPFASVPTGTMSISPAISPSTSDAPVTPTPSAPRTSTTDAPVIVDLGKTPVTKAPNKATTSGAFTGAKVGAAFVIAFTALHL